VIDRHTFARLEAHVRSTGVAVGWRRMKPDTPAIFDGLSIVLNDDHALGETAYYLVHSLGSIVGWSVDTARVKHLFEELRASKATKDAEPDRFERALAAFRAFEEASSAIGVGILHRTGLAELAADFSEFFRADLEAISLFHRTGALPIWSEFLAAWHRDLAAGRREPRPFAARETPPFTPVKIDEQEVKQGVRAAPGVPPPSSTPATSSVESE
jgi:hypothetical protein